MYQAAEDKPNGSSVESGPGTWFAVSLRQCTVGQIKGQLAKIRFH
jgi:hypothetical protein